MVLVYSKCYIFKSCGTPRQEIATKNNVYVCGACLPFRTAPLHFWAITARSPRDTESKYSSKICSLDLSHPRRERCCLRTRKNAVLLEASKPEPVVVFPLNTAAKFFSKL